MPKAGFFESGVGRTLLLGFLRVASCAMLGALSSEARPQKWSRIFVGILGQSSREDLFFLVDFDLN